MKFDVPDAWSLLRDAGQAWIEDRASTMGAALAYYTLFSAAPVALIVVAIAGLVFGERAARGEIAQQLTDLIGREGAVTVQSLLERVNHPFSGMLATVVGVTALLIGATSVFSELQSALDRVWRAPPPPPEHSIWVWLRARVLSLAMILVIGALIVVSVIATTALSTILRVLGLHTAATAPWTSGAVAFLASFAVVTVSFALIYKWLPRVHILWRDVWMGALMTALLFNLGKALIGLYIGSSGITSPFGAAGSLVALIVWVYWSAQIFLFGAEFTRVYACRQGSLYGRHTCAHRAAGVPAPDESRPIFVP